MKKLFSVLCLFLCFFQGQNLVHAVQFSDVSDIAQDLVSAISRLTDANIIHGYGDGTYRPLATISEQEWARLLLRSRGVSEQVDGYSSRPITRIEALSLLLRLWNVSVPEVRSSFSDVATADQSSVAYFELKGIVHGRSTGIFSPLAPMTRAEAAKILFLARQSMSIATDITPTVHVTQNVVEIVDVSPMTLSPSGSGSLLFVVRNHGDGQSGLLPGSGYLVSVLSGGVVITGSNELGNGLYQVLFRAPSYVPAGPVNIQIRVMFGGGYTTDINEYLRGKNAVQVGSTVSLARLVPDHIASGNTAQIVVTPQSASGDPVSGLSVIAEVTRGSGEIISPVVESPVGSGIYIGTYKARGLSGSQVEITVRVDNLASRPQTIIYGTVR